MRDMFSTHDMVCSSGNGGEFLTIHGFVVAKIQADDSSASKKSHVTTEAADVNIPVRCCTGSRGSGEASSGRFEGKGEEREGITGVECLLPVRHGVALWLGSGFVDMAPWEPSGPGDRQSGSLAPWPWHLLRRLCG